MARNRYATFGTVWSFELKRIADAMDGGDASQGIQNSLFFLEQKMHGQ